jgi:hypothetical protein
MSYSDVMTMPISLLRKCCAAYNRQKENDTKMFLCEMREMNINIISPHLKKQNRFKRPQDYKRFDWEKEDASNRIKTIIEKAKAKGYIK